MPALPTVASASPAAPANAPAAQYLRQLVDDPTGAAPGTIVVDPENRYLYLVQEDGKALRYGVGVGKAMSSGCIRMMNEDVTDLYDRVPAGTPVIVLPAHQTEA